MMGGQPKSLGHLPFGEDIQFVILPRNALVKTKILFILPACIVKFAFCAGTIFTTSSFIYFWLRWVFVAVCGLLIVVASLVAEHGL